MLLLKFKYDSNHYLVLLSRIWKIIIYIYYAIRFYYALRLSQKAIIMNHSVK